MNTVYNTYYITSLPIPEMSNRMALLCDYVLNAVHWR